jgi:hypothetical protein
MSEAKTPRTAVPNQIREPMGCVPSSAQPCPQYRTGAEGIFVISPSAFRVTVFRKSPQEKLARIYILTTKRVMPISGLIEKSSITP